MVLPDFDMIGHAMLLYFFLYHKIYYTAHPHAIQVKKPCGGLWPEIRNTKLEILKITPYGINK
jgi:hypothetical protein